MSYLAEVLKGNYGNYSEDRLSQIFSATFNNSTFFKRAFLHTISITKIPEFNKLISKTQMNFGSSNEDARIDIIIYKDNRPFIIIENKVESPLTKSQIIKYNKIKQLNKCKKVALV